MLKIANLTRITLVALLTLIAVSSYGKVWANETSEATDVDLMSNPITPPVLNEDGANGNIDSSMAAPINENDDEGSDY